MSRVRERLRKIHAEYGQSQPLPGYLVAMAGYGGLVAAFTGAAALTGRRLPERPRPSDAVLVTVAAYKLARLLAKDAVTSPIRAPFVRFTEPAGDGEVNEEVTATGVGHAIGELLTCPFCLTVWTGTALTGGLVVAPRLTRLVSLAFTAVAGADFLHLAYDAAKKKSGNAGE
jgi:Protein of unknown function (DUF1360)